MKKSLLALAVLGAFAGVASAQSSVTLFGTVDVAGRYVKADGQPRRLSEAADGLNSSQLGFRGVEDLGGGLKAGFTLISGFGANNGTTNSSKFFNRRSTISLLGGFGELRLGRDYTPTFWSQTIFDPAGTLGLGSSINVRQLYGGTRMDNSIGYLAPSNLGGFYGQVMAAAANGSGGASTSAAPSGDRFGRYLGGRVGFAAGPFDVAVAAGEQRRNDIPGAPQAKTYNVGGAWDFGVVKLMGYLDRDTLQTFRENMGTIGAVIPIGQSEIHVAYDRSKLSNSAVGGVKTSIDQIMATYQYNLSKRTAMYATASRLSNKQATQVPLPGAAGATSPGGKSTGAEFGVRHFF